MKRDYRKERYKGKTLMEWALIWFKTSNDCFFETYKFNFNPHDYPGLYKLAREEVFRMPKEAANIDLIGW